MVVTIGHNIVIIGIISDEDRQFRRATQGQKNQPKIHLAKIRKC